MRSEIPAWSWALRSLWLAAIFLAGLVGIVGSGGGGECGLLSDGCISIGPSTGVYLSPSRVTVPVGGSVTFRVTTNPLVTSFSVQWKRSRDGGATYVAIPGATDTSLTIAGAQLPDDDAWFLADVSSPGTQVFGPYQAAHLYVSSMPGVGFADGEFLPADWSATAVTVPSANGPTYSDIQAVTGGNPDAFRSMTYSFPAGTSSLRVSYSSRIAVYDPAVLGAIHTIDFSQDCIVTEAGASIGYVQTFPSIEQAGRRYAPAGYQPSCSSPSWQSATWSSLLSADLIQVDGPACGPPESCPDFSANGTPLTFGYVRQASQAASAPSAAIVHGIDNWKVTVWRR